MAIDVKPGQSVRVTINKTVRRESARKTLERLFMQDKSIRGPIEVRSRNFRELPKVRGGVVWTKRPNKVHPRLERGQSATVRATPQTIRDLNSIRDVVDVAPA